MNGSKEKGTEITNQLLDKGFNPNVSRGNVLLQDKQEAEKDWFRFSWNVAFDNGIQQKNIEELAAIAKVYGLRYDITHTLSLDSPGGSYQRVHLVFNLY